MSWAEIKKAVNSNLEETLDALIQRLYDSREGVGLHGKAIFVPPSNTAYADNFTVPIGIRYIYITACAPGGGGGGGAYYERSSGEYYNTAGGGGGGGQAIWCKQFSVTPGDVLGISIGAAGTGGAARTSSSSTGNGTNGGNTVIGSLITLTGGKYGAGGGSFNGAGGAAGGAGGGHGGRSNSGTDYFGQAGICSTGAPLNGGGGSLGGGGAGASFAWIPPGDGLFGKGGMYGGQGTGQAGYNTANLNGDSFGAGGGGFGGGGGGGAYRKDSSTGPTKGGDGGKGIVIIEW